MEPRIAEISAKPFDTENEFRVFSILQTLRITSDKTPRNVHYSDTNVNHFSTFSPTLHKLPNTPFTDTQNQSSW